MDWQKQHVAKAIYAALGSLRLGLFINLTACCSGCAEAKKLGDLGHIAQIAFAKFSADPTALKNKNPVRKIGDEIEILLDEQDGKASPLAQCKQRFTHFLDNRGLDTFCWFIEK